MIDLKTVLPNFILNDEFFEKLTTIANDYIDKYNENVKLLSFMENLDSFGDEILDEFAHDRGIFWYDSLLPVERKRDLIRYYRMTYRRLGTKDAVRQLIKDYFGGTGEVEEWYEYNETHPDSPMTHHHFNITIRAGGIPESFIHRFIDALYWVKSADTHLNLLSFIQSLTSTIYFKAALISVSETIRIEQDLSIKRLPSKIYFKGIILSEEETRRI